MTEEKPTPTPNININVSTWLVPTMFLWAVAAPCTMAVCRFTIAPELTWWDVTMPLWGVPAVLVGLGASVAGLVVGVLLLVVAVIVAVAPPIYVYAWLRDGYRSVWGWFESWRDARKEARILLDHEKIAEVITNRIKQAFASAGATDVSLGFESMDSGVKACFGLRPGDGTEITCGSSWSLLDAEGKPASFFRPELDAVINVMRKRRDDNRDKNRRASTTSH